MLTGRPATIFGDGATTRDYVYVGDVADAFVRAAQAPPELTGFYNIGTGEQTAVLDLYRMVADAVGCDIMPNFAPPRTGEVPRIALDRSKAARELGWVPSVRLEHGVKQTVSWLREFSSLPVVPARVGWCV